MINTLVRKYALGQCPAPKIYPHTHKSLSVMYIIPVFMIYWWNTLLLLLIYPNIVNTLVRKYALGQCPAPKIYPHIHKRMLIPCRVIYWWKYRLLLLLIYLNIVNTLDQKYALGQCPAPKIYPHIHKRILMPCRLHNFLWFTDGNTHYCYTNIS